MKKIIKRLFRTTFIPLLTAISFTTSAYAAFPFGNNTGENSPLVLEDLMVYTSEMMDYNTPPFGRSAAFFKSVIFEDGMTFIGTNYCASMIHVTEVTIPSTVTSIHDNAFIGSDAIQDVYYGGTEENWNNISFGYGNESLFRANIHYGGDEAAAEVVETADNETEISMILPPSMENPFEPVEQKINNDEGNVMESGRLFYVRKSWNDNPSQIGAFAVLQNDIGFEEANPVYAVFDENGTQIYPEINNPQSAEEIRPWQAAYQSLLSDTTQVDSYIDLTYVREYFRETGISFDKYFLYDVDKDSIPELFLPFATNMMAVFTYDDSLKGLGYDSFYSINTETRELIVQGHWHGAGGSGTDEWNIYSITHNPTGLKGKYIDKWEYEGEWEHSVYNDMTGGYEDDEERYYEIYNTSVADATTVSWFDLFDVNDMSGFNLYTE